MCSVARNFSRFASWRSVLIPVRCTTSSAEQETSEATPGMDVSTFGGAHAVTVAADIAGSKAAPLSTTGTAPEESDSPEGAGALEFERFSNPCFAIAALGAFGK